jgi:hypothetical protein
MKSSPAWLQTTKFGPEYTVRTRCPQCGRKHVTVFRLRHVSDSLFVHLGHFFPLRETLRLPAPTLVRGLGTTSHLDSLLKSFADNQFRWNLKSAKALDLEIPINYLSRPMK